MQRKLLFGLAAFAAAYIAYAIYLGVFGNDFSIVWRTANLPAADAYLRRTVNPFPYPPTTLVWLIPLRFVDPWPGFALWTLLGLGGLVASAWHLGGRRIAALTLLSPAAIACAVMGQFGNLAAILILFGARRGLASGALLGLAISIKPQLAFMAPVVLLARKDWAGLAGLAGAWAAVLAAELLLFGVQPWRDWIDGMAFFHQMVIKVGGNVASANPAGFAEYLGFPIYPFWAAGIALSGMLIWRCAASGDQLELAALILLASVLASPYAIIYDLGAAVPFFALRAKRDELPSILALAAPWTSAAIVWQVIASVRRALHSQGADNQRAALPV